MDAVGHPSQLRWQGHRATSPPIMGDDISQRLWVGPCCPPHDTVWRRVEGCGGVVVGCGGGVVVCGGGVVGCGGVVVGCGGGVVVC